MSLGKFSSRAVIAQAYSKSGLCVFPSLRWDTKLETEEPPATEELWLEQTYQTGERHRKAAKMFDTMVALHIARHLDGHNTRS